MDVSKLVDGILNTDTSRPLPIGTFVVDIEDAWERVSNKDSTKYIKITGEVISGDISEEMPEGSKAKVSFSLGATNGGDSKRDQLLKAFVMGSYYQQALSKTNDPVKAEKELAKFKTKLSEKDETTLGKLEKMCANLLPSEGTSKARGTKIKVVSTKAVSKAGREYKKQNFYPYLG